MAGGVAALLDKMDDAVQLIVNAVPHVLYTYKNYPKMEAFKQISINAHELVHNVYTWLKTKLILVI